MFLDNKYTKWYWQIIERARFREIDCYVEKHHIIPRCMEGSNTSENIVKLTGREHFIIHKLLVKMFTGFDRKRMGFALWRFMSECKNHSGRKSLSSREFEMVRKMVNDTMKGIKPSQACYDALSKKLKGVPLTDEHKQKLREANTVIIECSLIGPDDTIYGVSDLAKFCIEQDLSFHYFWDLLYVFNTDTRITCGKRKGWGIYRGIIQSVPEQSENRKTSITEMWAKEKEENKGKLTNRNTQFKWVLQDPEGTVHTVYSLGQFAKSLGKFPGPIQKSELGLELQIGTWKGWIKLEQTKHIKER